MFGKLKKAAEAAAKELGVGGAKEEEKPKAAEAAPAAAAAAPAEEKREEEAGMPRLSDAEANDVAKKLRDAMEGLGTNEELIITCVAPLNGVQAAQVTEAYNTQFERDLIKDIKSETGGKFEDLLVALLEPPAEFAARQVKSAVKGIGTDEKRLIEALCVKTDEELRAMHDAYKKLFGALMADDVEGDCKGKLKDTLIGLLNQAIKHGGRKEGTDEEMEEDILRLYKAGEDKIGTNTGVFITILTERSPAYVQRLGTEYAKKYGRPLTKVIKKELSGDIEEALVALASKPHEYLAEKLYEAMKGAGSDDKTMLRIIVGQRDTHLTGICETFVAKYEKSLIAWVKGEVRGDLEKTFVAVIEKRQ